MTTDTGTGMGTDTDTGTETDAPPGPTERLVFFSDAVFAIAITLLVLPLTEARPSEEHLVADLLGLWPELLSFALSFVVVGTFWLGHHRAFSRVRRVDGRLVGLNLGFLACVAFLPFPTAVLGDHGDTVPAVVLYAAAMTVTGTASAAVWWHASADRQLLAPGVDDATVRYLRLRSLVVPAAFLPSVPLALLSPLAAWLCWLLAWPLTAAVHRLAGRA